MDSQQDARTPDDAASSAARLDEVSEALEGLRITGEGEEPLDAVLHRLAHTAVRAVPDADAVSITVLGDDGPRTPAATDDDAEAIDGVQYAARRGPCLHAARTRRPVRAVVGEHRDEWPEFTTAAQKAGVHAYLSVPVLLADEGVEQLLGAFNCYSQTEAAFDPFDEGLMRLLTTAASAAIGNAGRWHRSRRHTQHLRTALTSRADIDQAKGALMAIHGVDAEEAFARLVEESQRNNVKLYDVARRLLSSLQSR